MKYIVLSLLCFSFTSANSQITEHEKNESFIKIWGLLKYFQSEISDGKLNFDKEFLNEFQKVELIETKEDFDNEMVNWIKSFGIDKLKSKEEVSSDKLFTKNHDFNWINESNFSSTLSILLNELKHNSNYKNHYAKVKKLSSSVDFSNDIPLPNFDSSILGHRLLFLASFWNAMQYWNINIYLTETAWEEILGQLLLDFTQEGRVNFEKAKEKLFSKLNDSHADYSYSYTLNSVKNFPSFGGRIINDSLIITDIFNEKTFKLDSLQKGDVIYGVNDTILHEYYKNKFSEVISASNSNYLRRAIEKSYLFASNTDSLLVNILKTTGQNTKQYIQLNPLLYFSERYIRLRPQKSENWRDLDSEIGYINLYEINEEELKEAFNHFDDYKGVVIDLRNYPRKIGPSEMAKYLYPEKSKFLKILVASKPSYGIYDSNPALSIFINPFKAGKRNNDYFKGKVILLVDRSTASMAEFIGMAIQASPNCITIGEQTFGAVMNRNEVPLKDGTTIDYTGVGAFYPDDEGVQRQGLRIDHYVQESAKHYQSDLYLKKALNLIKDEE